MDDKPKWHHKSLDAAIKRAKSLTHGKVIWSTAPGTEDPRAPGAEFGFWSEGGDVGMIRLWERVVWPEDHH
jgi:hypothetical protein